MPGNKHLTIRIKTLTPIWTGGVNGKCDRLHETGIIGNLRWWYEAIVGGLGGYVCDTAKESCSFDIKEYKNAKKREKSKPEALHAAGLCDVCQIFGATGWKKQFNLSVIEDSTEPAWKEDIILNIRPEKRAIFQFVLREIEMQ